MQPEVELFVRNLHVISSLMPHDKLNTENATFTKYDPTYSRAIFRWYYGENRESNLTKVQQVIRQATLFMTQTLSSSKKENETIKDVVEQQQCKRVFDILKQSENGLRNMLQTYKEDVSICAKIEMLIDEINDFCISFEQIMKLNIPIQ